MNSVLLQRLLLLVGGCGSPAIVAEPIPLVTAEPGGEEQAIWALEGITLTGELISRRIGQ